MRTHLRRLPALPWMTLTVIAALIAASCTTVDREDLPVALPADETAPPGTDPTPGDPEVVDTSPLSVDDAVEIGVLDNGLTYYLRENGAPGGSLTVRLAVDAGSRQQEVPDDGVAHFLEHMLFNGTERWPGNELDRVLQTLGAGIGPDINAYTSFDETVYELTVSTFEPDAVDTAFAVLAEWSSRATIDPDEVIAERGVVRDEYRQRVENGAAAISNALLEVYLADTPYAGRLPIGSATEIETTEAPELRRFYDRWYHPENMAVVVVGDLPVDTMREQLDDAFAGIEGRGPAPGRASVLTIEPQPEASAGVLTDPEEVVDNLSVDWMRPPADASTVGGARLMLVDDLIASMLTQRLDDAYLAGDFSVDRPPFLSRFGVARHLEFFGTNLRGDDLSLAYAQLLGYLAGAARDGFGADELDQAIESRLAGLEAWEETLPTTQDLAWSAAYVAHFLTGVGAEAPQTTIERERTVLAELTLDEIDRRWSLIHESSGPIAVALGADEATLPTAVELEAVAASVEPIGPAAAEAEIAALMVAPDPVEPVSTEETNGIFDTRIVRRYGNGATMVFERSPIAEGSVLLIAEGLGGASTYAIEDHSLAPTVASIVSRSGLGKASTGQLADFLADRSVGLEATITDYTEGFEGAASTDDTEILFQLLHLSVTAPSVDPTVFTSALVDADGLLQQLETDPGLAASVALSELVLADPAYGSIPTRTQLDDLTEARVLELYRQRLGTVDDLIVSVVGDIDPDTVAAFADSYLGTLPAGEPDRYRDVSAPPVTSVQRVDIELPADSGDAGMVLRWERDTVSTGDAAAAAVLQQILSSLIFDTAREELGASYGGSATISTGRIPRSTVVGVVAIDGDPARLDEIKARLFADIERLSTQGPTVDEFERARSVLLDDLQFINNLEMLVENIETERTGEPPALAIATRVEEVLGVDRSEVRRLAFSLFDLDAHIEVRRS